MQQHNENAVTLETATLRLRIAVAADRPAMLWSSPGVGKSALVAQLAAELDAPLVDVRCHLLDPVDWRGIPDLAADRTVWKRPAILPDSTPAGGVGLLFLDELTQAPTQLQAPALQLVLDRRVGEHAIAPGWRIIAAGNYSTDRTGAHEMLSALRSRFATHIHVRPDAEVWLKWAREAQLHPVVIAFVSWRPALLYSFDPETDGNGETYACPRTFEFLSDALRHGADRLDVRELQGFARSCIGPAGNEFAAFWQTYRDLPNLDDLISGRTNVPEQIEPSTAYALAACLTDRAVDAHATMLERLAQIATQLPAEMAGLALRQMVAVNRSTLRTQAAGNWTKQHSTTLTN